MTDGPKHLTRDAKSGAATSALMRILRQIHGFLALPFPMEAR